MKHALIYLLNNKFSCLGFRGVFSYSRESAGSTEQETKPNSAVPGQGPPAGAASGPIITWYRSASSLVTNSTPGAPRVYQGPESGTTAHRCRTSTQTAFICKVVFFKMCCCVFFPQQVSQNAGPRLQIKDRREQ